MDPKWIATHPKRKQQKSGAEYPKEGCRKPLKITLKEIVYPANGVLNPPTAPGPPAPPCGIQTGRRRDVHLVRESDAFGAGVFKRAEGGAGTAEPEYCKTNPKPPGKPPIAGIGIIALIGLLLDDLSGVGIADDVLIPIVWTIMRTALRAAF